MKIFEELYRVLMNQSKQIEIIKRYKFYNFRYILIKEIYEYLNNISQ